MGSHCFEGSILNAPQRALAVDGEQKDDEETTALREKYKLEKMLIYSHYRAQLLASFWLARVCF